MEEGSSCMVRRHELCSRWIGFYRFVNHFLRRPISSPSHLLLPTGVNIICKGIFARADTRNNNRRVYPMKILKREADRFEHERINTGTALGEVDHPSYNSNYFRSLNLANISHQVYVRSQIPVPVAFYDRKPTGSSFVSDHYINLFA